MKKNCRIICKTFALLLTFVMLLSLVDFTPVQAASDDMKVVYTLKQLKKALKSKSGGSIVFRTEVNDSITIPSVKAAKNKDVYIVAPNLKIKNKSKFKSITLKSVAAYTEAVSGNTIIWYNPFETDFIVTKGKTVSRLVCHCSGDVPPYILRKGAKVKKVEFVAYDGTTSTSDAKKKTASIMIHGEYDYEYDTKVTYSFDKNGRIVGLKEEYSDGDSVYSYKYDKNGNCIKCIRPDGDTIESQYDSDNILLKIEYISDGEAYYIVSNEYDKNGNLVQRLTENKYVTGGVTEYHKSYENYKYDKNGRCTEDIYENKEDDVKITFKYLYDKAGRRIEQTIVRNGDTGILEYSYDDNGLLVEKMERSVGKVIIYGYSRDFLGNEIFNVNKNYYKDDDSEDEYYKYRYENYVGEYLGDYPRYEDGFVSAVGDVEFDSVAYEKAGYTVVSTPKEFIEAIAPGAKIIINQYYMNLSDYLEELDNVKFNADHEYVRLNRQTDGYELVIDDVDDLLISGANPNTNYTELVIDPRYSAVLRFESCDNLKLNSFCCGHTERGGCEGNVIDLYNCKNVGIYGMEIYGCGVYGIGAYEGSGDVRVYNSTIRSCEYGIYDFTDLGDKVTFSNCIFYNSNGGGDYFGRNDDSPDVIFKKCTFGENETKSLYLRSENIYIDCMWDN